MKFQCEAPSPTHQISDSYSALHFGCLECSQQLGLAPTFDGRFDSCEFSIVCMNPRCAIEYSLNEVMQAYPRIVEWLPDGEDASFTKYGRGREDSLVFGKALGSNQSGNDRNRLMRHSVEAANPSLHETPQGVKAYYELKAHVGVFEDKTMRLTLEMTSRKIRQIEHARHVKIPEPVIDRIAKLVRKGVRAAEERRPTTTRERRLIVETILARTGLWPP